MKQVILAAGLAVLMATASQAQSPEFKRRSGVASQVGISVGATSYYGDLVPANSSFSSTSKYIRPSAGVSFTHSFSPYISARASYTWARIAASDEMAGASQPDRRQRNLSFRNDIHEVAVVAMTDLLPQKVRFGQQSQFVPYAFAGLAVLYHNPKAYFKGNDLLEEGWYALQPLRTEGQVSPYKRVQMAVPFGLGMRYRISSSTNLSFEIGWRKTFTDYLDDVSTVYADKGKLNAESGAAAWILSDRSIEMTPDTRTYTGADGNQYPHAPGTGTPGSVRGNHEQKDWYFISGFQLSYNLESLKQIRLPKFR